MEVRRLRLRITDVMTSTETMGIMDMAKYMSAETNTKRMVMRKFSHTDITEKAVIMRYTDTTGKAVIMKDTNIEGNTDTADVTVTGSMRERGVTEKEQEERFRLILMPGGPRGCMLGCENADTTCFTGRGHMSARNAC